MTSACNKIASKMQCSILFCLIIAIFAFANAESNYEGHKVYDVRTKDNFERQLLRNFADNDDYDFFSFSKLLHKPVRLMVKPEHQEEFEKSLRKYGIQFEIRNSNVALSIVPKQIQFADVAGNEVTPDLFSKFQRYDEVNAYLKTLSKRFPKRVELKKVGKSFEGRELISIRITNGDGRQNKKVIFIDAGIHAREWIAPATALYIINQLTENFEENAHLLKDYDWLILPVVNPDGYEYTHTKDRLWRKTRKPINEKCIGTDGNRNYGYHWGDSGSSSYPCSVDYMGPKPFSEPETQIVRDMMNSLKGRGKMYLSLHSFGNHLLYPWAFTDELPITWKDMDEVAKAGAFAIHAATGTSFDFGSATNVLYTAAGNSVDYAYGEAGIPIAMTMELQGGGDGFDPTVEQIKPFVKEAWIGIKAMAEKVILKY